MFRFPPAGANWVDPPKRERKRVASYAENEFYRMAMQVGNFLRKERVGRPVFALALAG